MGTEEIEASETEVLTSFVEIRGWVQKTERTILPILGGSSLLAIPTHLIQISCSLGWRLPTRLGTQIKHSVLWELRGIRGWRTQIHITPSSPSEAAWFFITLFTDDISEEKTLCFDLECKCVYICERVYTARLVIRNRQSLVVWV